jgi:hypothetical protein
MDHFQERLRMPARSSCACIAAKIYDGDKVLPGELFDGERIVREARHLNGEIEAR